MIVSDLFNGLKMLITDDTPVVVGASWVYERGKWHPHGLDTLKWAWDTVDRLHAQVVVDGGANAGSYAITLAKHPAVKRVYAYEPAPAVCAVLRKNVELNQVENKVVVRQAALNKTTDPCDFMLAENAAYSHTGSKMLRSHGHGACPPLKYQVIKVESAMLDELSLKENKVDFIKLDLEGGELKALHGASQLLQRDHPCLLYEYQKENTAQHGYAPEEIEELLGICGYRGFSWVGTIDRTANA